MYAVIRVRGSVNLNPEIKATLQMLNLHKINHLVLLKEEPSFKGMLFKAQAYLTYGEINEETLSKLLKKKARLLGDKKIEVEFLKKNKIKNFEEMAKSLIDGKIALKELGIKPVLRLRPPSKGYERGGIKKAFAVGGVSGYRATEINALIKKMI